MHFNYLILEEFTLSANIANNQFLLANIDFSGFYRVNYEPDNWRKIIAQLWNNKDVGLINNY
jgi:hypothetical protein